VPKKSTKLLDFPPTTSLAEQQKMQTLFATHENQMNRLYGGRMNDARKMEAKVVTDEALENLHLWMNTVDFLYL